MCHECGKKYKTRGGFQRHRAAKHGQQKDREEMTLTPGILGQIVCSAVLSIKENKVFSASIRNELDLYSFEDEKEKSASESCNDCHAALSEREKAGLQYVGGYVLHKLHGKHFLRDSVESQQAMAILKAGKLETSDRSQKLIASVNRGGLWSITEHVQKIFLKAEATF